MSRKRLGVSINFQKKRYQTFVWYPFLFWCRGTESNCRHGDFQSITPGFLTSSIHITYWNHWIRISTSFPIFANFSRFRKGFPAQNPRKLILFFINLSLIPTLKWWVAIELFCCKLISCMRLHYRIIEFCFSSGYLRPSELIPVSTIKSQSSFRDVGCIKNVASFPFYTSFSAILR